MVNVPIGAFISGAFGGVAKTSDGHSFVLKFNADKPGDKPLHVTVPADRIGAVVSSICAVDGTIEQAGGLKKVQIFTGRDAQVNVALSDALVLRIGFEKESNIRFSISRDQARRLAALLEEAAKVEPPHKH